MNTSKNYKTNFAEIWGAMWTFATLAIPFVTVLAAWEGHIWAWLVPITILVVIPLSDHLLRRLDHDWFQTKGQISDGLKHFYAAVQVLYNILHLPVFILVLFGLKNNLEFFSAVGTVLSFAIYGSILLGNSHDLMHRRSKSAYILGILNQKLFFFPANFEIEHISRHHTRQWMCKTGDVESAPRGMTFYRFFRELNSEGDKINLVEEKIRLEQKGLPWRSIHNRLLQSRFARFALVICLVVFFPILIAIIGMIMLFLASASFSCSGYFQHYGLERHDREDGKSEPITDKDSWDRNDPIGKYIYFGGTRHPIHHKRPALPYWKQLRTPTGVHELPLGYHQIALLTLVPPLFRKVMDTRMRELGILEETPWKGRLKVRKRKGRDLSEKNLEGLVKLRETVMEFKSTELLLVEREKLKTYAKSVDYAYLIEDAEGSVFGCFLIDFLDSKVKNRVLVQIDYMYVHPQLSGESIYTKMLMRAGVNTIWKAKGKEIWFIAIGAYPMGYRSVWKFGGLMTHSKDPNLPADVRETMITLAAKQCKERWNPETECVEISTVPPTYPEEVVERFKKESWWEPYHSVCPHWHEGYGLLATYRISKKDFKDAFKNRIQRKWKSKIKK